MEPACLKILHDTEKEKIENQGVTENFPIAAPPLTEAEKNLFFFTPKESLV